MVQGGGLQVREDEVMGGSVKDGSCEKKRMAGLGLDAEALSAAAEQPLSGIWGLRIDSQKDWC